jgi:hypothetical protein
MPDPLAVSLVLWGRKGMIMAKPQEPAEDRLKKCKSQKSL